jgi:hypothetical protein
MQFIIPRKISFLYTGLIFSIFILVSGASAQVRMRGNLLLVNTGGSILLDGNMTNYDNQYSNNVDGNDIWKLSNFAENLGVLRGTANLVIERRSLISLSDTTYFRIWNLQQRHYRFQVIAENLQQNNLYAFLRDQYLGIDSPVSLNDTTDVDFFVTSQPGSYAPNRFILIYKTSVSILPVTFTGIHAVRQLNAAQINWQVENETGIEKYVVEKSLDGLSFKKLTEVSSAHTSVKNAYAALDQQPENGMLFYRIKAVGLDGKVEYSSIVRVQIGLSLETISVFPNPVQNKLLHLQAHFTETGKYQMSIVHSNGILQALPSFITDAGYVNKTLQLPAILPAGIYQLRMVSPGGKLISKNIMVL